LIGFALSRNAFDAAVVTDSPLRGRSQPLRAVFFGATETTRTDAGLENVVSMSSNSNEVGLARGPSLAARSLDNAL